MFLSQWANQQPEPLITCSVAFMKHRLPGLTSPRGCTRTPVRPPLPRVRASTACTASVPASLHVQERNQCEPCRGIQSDTSSLSSPISPTTAH